MMEKLIEFSLRHVRTVLFLFAFIIIAGFISYINIPKESTPDVQIPLVIVNLSQQGISPEDSERLLVRPIEQSLQSLEGLKEMQSTIYEGGGHILLKYYAGVDIARAIASVRDKVNTAKVDLPDDADEPVVEEVNLSLFPVLVVQFAGDVPERYLINVAREVQDQVDGISEVLQTKLIGDRESIVEVIIDPLKVESYGLSPANVLGLFTANNMIIPSGTLKLGAGSYVLKAPGRLNTVEEVANVPIIQNKEKIVYLKDIASVRKSFKDAESYARSSGKPALALEVSKRMGQNIIETIEDVKSVVKESMKKFGDNISIFFTQDGSHHIRDMLNELQNNIISAVLLVMVVIVLSLGFRSALLVGAAVPASFLAGILVIGALGFTLNIVVLFSLILSVGMLVDGAIIVVEYADRKMLEGYNKFDSYLMASKRMLWPVITSTITVLVVFLPLLFWPGVPGQFMKYLPITLLATLAASLFVALIFVPSLGSLFGAVSKKGKKALKSIMASENGPLHEIKGFSGWYVRLLQKASFHPMKIITASIVLLVGIVWAYKNFGKGVEFFPDIEPDQAAFVVKARGNLSLDEKDRLVKGVENKILQVPEFSSVYTRVGKASGTADDAIGVITVEFVDWKKRAAATAVLDRVSKEVDVFPGITVEVSKEKSGPSDGKPIFVEVTSKDYDDLAPAIEKVRKYVEEMNGVKDIEDSRPLPGIEWVLEINRGEAAKFNSNVAQIGSVLQLVTDGVLFGSYRPEDERDEVDILARFPKRYRNLSQLDQLRINNGAGSVPLGNFVKRVPKPKVSMMKKVNGKLMMSVSANVATGILVDDKVQEIKAWLSSQEFKDGVNITLKGEEADKAETGAFLGKAFLVSLFLIAVILVTQFNSFFSALLVLSSIVLSTIGVLIGLLIMDQAFSIVMTGIGVIALSGIIVSNNIIFIDTFDTLVREGKESVRDIIIRTGAQRLRPIILTQLTTILGLLPILFGMDIDFLARNINVGAPTGQWWIQLSTAIVFGVFFASIMTLLVTPSALMVRENFRSWRLNRTKIPT